MKMLKVFLGLTLMAIGSLALVVSNCNALDVSPAVSSYFVQPGETIRETVTLYNNTDRTSTFRPVFQDFTSREDESGTPDFLPEGTLAPTGSLASWFQSLESITFEPSDRFEMEIVINVPENAEPGGHYAGVLLEESAQRSSSGAGVGGKVGPIFLVNVDGDIKEELEMLEFRTEPEGKTFFSRKPVDLVLRIKNTGSVHQNPKGLVKIEGWWPKESQFGYNVGNNFHVLPNSTRQFEIKWDAENIQKGGFFAELMNELRNFAIGPFQATANMRYGLNTKTEFTAVSNTFWVIPWHVLLVLLIIIIVLIIGLKGYNKMVVKGAEKKKMKHEKKKSKK